MLIARNRAVITQKIIRNQKYSMLNTADNNETQLAETSQSLESQSKPDSFSSLHRQKSQNHTGLPSGSKGKRYHIASEMLTTEEFYINSLQSLLLLFYTPLVQLAGSQTEILSMREITAIFSSDFTTILQINKELFRGLQKCLDEWDKNDGDGIGAVFLLISPYLKVYSTFITNFNNSLQTLANLTVSNVKFAEFIANKSKSPECKLQTIQSFLLMPIQRIPRYKMLLDDYMRNTKDSHADYLNVVKAHHIIAEVATHVNEKIRENQNVLSIIEIQRCMTGRNRDLVVPGRILLHRGPITKISRKSHDCREMFLFSDIILLASIVKYSYSQSETQFLLHREFKLEDIKVMSVECENTCTFQIVSRDKSILVYVRSEEEREKWIHDIDNAISRHSASKKSLKSDRHAPKNVAADMVGFAPVWVNDDKVMACALCLTPFTFYWRRHHCRSCGSVICGTCSLSSFFIQKYDGEEKARACDGCITKIINDGKHRVELGASIDNSMNPVQASDVVIRRELHTYRDSIDSIANSLSSFRATLSKNGKEMCSLCLSNYSLLNWKVNFCLNLEAM